MNLLDLIFRRIRILAGSLRSLDTARKIDLTKWFAAFAPPPALRIVPAHGA
jgi:hypothetical protein